jgi:hypothetical protein
MKTNIGERIHVAFQLLKTKEGMVGAIETGIDGGFTTRSLITHPQQLLDVIYEINEAIKQHGKKITHFPDRHSDIFKQHTLKDF